ncbi:hypothetical protein VMT65_31230 [Nocardia sp. CDC153]|uniref:hypothetical protein n=1 Tax=Nocardia sp. CDC153 TaxID=3112167 RepID=UPI002DBB78F3|nr:hypothetical protein [Nocardia sp. CDC153]MEC3957543.1 hypothetical protein [Nocardia sp. CDC153]
MTTPDRITCLLNQAAAAVLANDDAALDRLMSSLDDHDLEALIGYLAKGFDIQVRFLTADDHREEPQ